MSRMSSAVTADKVRTGAMTAEDVVRRTLADIHRRNALHGAFTRVFDEAAVASAQLLDARIAAGEDPGPLAGVPFAVKDLFDVAGCPTTAGAYMRRDAVPARQDAEAVRRLKAAGAVLVGTLNMDEYAYGFATVNAHFGTTRNPHDITRLAGGSSGGSAAAVAAGLVPLTLGSDTNGSIRVPASLCGVWGMRPVDGAIPLDGVFPFVEALDTIGPFTRTVSELRLAYEVLSGTTPVGGGQPRVARLGGFFARNASAEAVSAIDAVMDHLGAGAVVDLPDAESARSAAFLITAAQGGALHLDTLRTRAMDYDPAVRDRLIAGALLPAAAYVQAWQLRARWRRQVAKLFESYDIVLAPATPSVAPRIDEGTILIDGKPVSARANLGIYCQALSLAGVPVVSAPISTVRSTPGDSSRLGGEAAAPNRTLPIGVQFATAPGREGMLFDLLERLEAEGVLGAKELT